MNVNEGLILWYLSTSITTSFWFSANEAGEHFCSSSGSSLPPALPPPGTVPAAPLTPASAWGVWTDSSGAGTRPGSGGSTPADTGGTAGPGVTGGTGTAAAGTPRFADPTGRRGREDRPPQTRAGTASWPACVLRGGGRGGVQGAEVKRMRGGERTGGRNRRRRR